MRLHGRSMALLAHRVAVGRPARRPKDWPVSTPTRSARWPTLAGRLALAASSADRRSDAPLSARPAGRTAPRLLGDYYFSRPWLRQRRVAAASAPPAACCSARASSALVAAGARAARRAVQRRLAPAWRARRMPTLRRRPAEPRRVPYLGRRLHRPVGRAAAGASAPTSACWRRAPASGRLGRVVGGSQASTTRCATCAWRRAAARRVVLASDASPPLRAMSSATRRARRFAV